MTNLDDPIVERLGAHIVRHAGEWFPGEKVSAALLDWRHERPASCVYRFRLEPTDRAVVVKVARHDVVRVDPSARPRVVPRIDAGTKHAFEARSLVAVQAHLASLADERFRAIRLLDRLADPEATITEFVPWPSLHALLQRAAVRRWTVPVAAAANTGSWLQAYHAAAPLPDATPRDGRPADYLTTLDRLVIHLRGHLDADPLLDAVAARASEVALGVLPDPVPLVTAHGDFGPPNILVGPDGAVAVLDLLGRWRAPAHEDMGYFLASMQLNSLMLRTVGRGVPSRVLDGVRTAFLRGYHGRDACPPELVLYELNATMDIAGSRLDRLTGTRRRLAMATIRRRLRALGRALRATG